MSAAAGSRWASSSKWFGEEDVPRPEDKIFLFLDSPFGIGGEECRIFPYLYFLIVLKATESPFGCCCLPTWCSTIMHISLAAIALVLAPFVSSALGFAHFQRSRATFAPTLPEAPSVFLASQSAESATGNEVDLENEDDEDHRLNGASSPASLDPTSIHRDTSPWSQDELARQLTEYMAKAHEEKLRAIRLVEDT